MKLAVEQGVQVMIQISSLPRDGKSAFLKFSIIQGLCIAYDDRREPPKKEAGTSSGSCLSLTKTLTYMSYGAIVLTQGQK